MNHLDLCTGIGGFHLAADWAGFETIGFSEVDDYCCALLEDKWPEIKNYGDLRTADFSDLRGRVDVLSAGVPCQPASLAGKRRGKDDDRWLWPATLDVVGLVQPAWCIFENPDGILTLDEFTGVLLRLETLGYEVRMFRVPANAVGARHMRSRVFIVANNDSLGRRGRECQPYRSITGKTEQRIPQGPSGAPMAHSECINGEWRRSGRGEENGVGSRDAVNGSSEDSEALADRNGSRQPQQSGIVREIRERPFDDGEAMADATSIAVRSECSYCISKDNYRFRLTEPPLCRATDGISNRSHRLKSLGNSVVPQQAFPFFQAIAQVMEE